MVVDREIVDAASLRVASYGSESGIVRSTRWLWSTRRIFVSGIVVRPRDVTNSSMTSSSIEMSRMLAGSFSSHHAAALSSSSASSATSSHWITLRTSAGMLAYGSCSACEEGEQRWRALPVASGR